MHAEPMVLSTPTGPWEFNTGADTQAVSNRQTRERPYDRVSGRTGNR